MKIQLQHREVRFPLLPVLALAVIVIGAFMSMRLGRIDASEVGILINNLTGRIAVRMEPGSFFYNGWYTDLHRIDKTLHTLKMRSDSGEHVRLKTVDGPDVHLDVEVNYKLLLDENTIRSKIVPESGVAKIRDPRSRRTIEAYQDKWIRDYSRSVIRYVFGTLTTEDFYDSKKRDDTAREAEVELNRLLHPHGIEVTKVVPDKFKFYDEYERLIREKKEADQEKEKQEELAKAAVEDQKKQEVEATKRAEVEVEQIKGLLQKQKIAAEAEAVQLTKSAEAYAYKTRIDADAAFYQAEREAKGILAAASAEAAALANLVKALHGEGGRNLVLRELASALGRAQIEGLPYATSPVVQRLSVEPPLPAAKGEQR